MRASSRFLKRIYDAKKKRPGSSEPDPGLAKALNCPKSSRNHNNHARRGNGPPSHTVQCCQWMATWPLQPCLTDLHTLSPNACRWLRRAGRRKRRPEQSGELAGTVAHAVQPPHGDGKRSLCNNHLRDQDLLAAGPPRRQTLKKKPNKKGNVESFCSCHSAMHPVTMLGSNRA